MWLRIVTPAREAANRTAGSPREQELEAGPIAREVSHRLRGLARAVLSNITYTYILAYSRISLEYRQPNSNHNITF